MFKLRAKTVWTVVLLARLSELLSVKILVGKREELILCAREKLKEGGVIATVNPYMIADAMKNGELFRALEGALCIPDGVGITLAFRALGERAERIAGVELVEELLSGTDVRLGIVGGREGRAAEAMKSLARGHSFTPCFAHSGYGYDERVISELIDNSGANLVLLSLGSPKQEIFASELSKRHGGVLFMGIGGGVDIYSGHVRRAPKFMRLAGLEWLYRIAAQPYRILRLGKAVKFLSNVAIYELLLRKKLIKTDKIDKK